MTQPFRAAVFCIALFAIFGPNRVLAAGPDDGGTDGDAPFEADVPSGAVGETSDDSSADASDDPSADASGGGGIPGAPGPLGCDGALCSTTTGGTTCSTAQGLGSTRDALPTSVALLFGAVGLATLRRRIRRQQEQVR